MRGPVPAGDSPAIRRRSGGRSGGGGTLSGTAPERTIPVPDRRHRPDAGNPAPGIEKQYGPGPRRTPRWRPGGDAFDQPDPEIGIVFDRRSDLVKLIAVADAGGILAAAERLAITQPALSRVIARLELRFGGRLFERLPSGVRLTPLGTVAADRARHVLREIEAAEAKIAAAVSGRAGRFRITADPMWMEAVLAPAIARFRDTCPGIELTLRTASFAAGLRRLTRGESDLHCGAIDAGAPLPAFLRRDHVLDTTAGIVAHAEHPLLAGRPAVRDLVSWPWIDYGGTAQPAAGGSGPPSPDGVLDALHARTGRRVKTVLRADAAGLFLLATGPWLARLPLDFLDGLPGTPLRPLPLGFGRCRCPAGSIARRSAEDLAPFRLLEKAVRDAALERSGSRPGSPARHAGRHSSTGVATCPDRNSIGASVGLGYVVLRRQWPGHHRGMGNGRNGIFAHAGA